MKNFISIHQALDELQQGKMLILVDDENRENEGDLMIAASKVNAASLNFMAKYARGQICLALHPSIVNRLNIPFMEHRNGSPNQASFTHSIEAAKGVTSGASSKDRVHTIQVAIDPASCPEDIAIPGHVFPLCGRSGGVLERPGHTEGSIELAQLAALEPAAVICEIMNEDGTMARSNDLQQFSLHHQISLVAINDLVSYCKELKHALI